MGRSGQAPEHIAVFGEPVYGRAQPCPAVFGSPALGPLHLLRAPSDPFYLFTLDSRGDTLVQTTEEGFEPPKTSLT